MRKLPRIDLRTDALIFLCALFYFDPAGTFAPFLLSSALHEIGHILCLVALEVPIEEIRISCNGAVIRTRSLPYVSEFFAAASGPAANLLLFSFFHRSFPLFALINLCLFTYNSLPLYPLDGGRILRAVLHLSLNDRAAMRAERIVGFLFLAVLGCGAVCASYKLRLGLWPILAFGLLLIKIAGVLLPEQQTPPFVIRYGKRSV